MTHRHTSHVTRWRTGTVFDSLETFLEVLFLTSEKGLASELHEEMPMEDDSAHEGAACNPSVREQLGSEEQIIVSRKGLCFRTLHNGPPGFTEPGRDCA